MKHRVDIVESEAGWGRTIDEIKYFDTKEEAEKFVSEYNLMMKNFNQPSAWYMMAIYRGAI